ncbi:hypothetical protein [Cupriavidus sp. CuC1]|uniref:hypothetical protein n=1 Tax=Cupriavidus sp. CuC1 TaxID=3373131 RepID=UPI0037D07A03
MAEAKVRVSHIAVPGNLSVLKLKSYLRTAVADAADTESEAKILLIKVLVPRPLGLRAGKSFLTRCSRALLTKIRVLPASRLSSSTVKLRRRLLTRVWWESKRSWMSSGTSWMNAQWM